MGDVGIYERYVLPRLINFLLNLPEYTEIRARVCAPLEGSVLEVGFGSGLNVAHYPPAVSRVLAVDPALLGRKLAARKVADSPVPVEFIGLDGQSLPLDSGSVDHALSTWTLCTIPDAEQAMAEIVRVLRPGGTFHFVEHGHSPSPKVAQWQDRLTPIQKRVAGGCHLNRPIDDIVAGSGLAVDKIDNHYMSGPKPYGYIFEGTATKP